MEDARDEGEVALVVAAIVAVVAACDVEAEVVETAVVDIPSGEVLILRLDDISR
jgi:hypothetical protein